MKKIKLLILTILTMVSSAFLFACSTTTSDTNVYCEIVALYHNNTEVSKSANGANYEISLYAGSENYEIKYVLYPSNATIGGVKVSGENASVATISVENLYQKIIINPADTFTSGNTSTTFSITSNDGKASAVLTVNLLDSSTFNKLITPDVNIESINGEYFATWNNVLDLEANKHFAGYGVYVDNQLVATTLNTKYKLSTTSDSKTIKIKALSNFNDKSSDFSAEKTYILFNAPLNLKYNTSGSFQWAAVSMASQYDVLIQGTNTYVSQRVPSTSFAFDLTDNDEYTVIVKAAEDVQSGVYSQSSILKVTQLNVLDATIDNNQITWNSTGPAKSYTVNCYEGATLKNSKTNAQSPLKITSLGVNFERGKTYTFKVIAVGDQTNIFTSAEVVAGSMKKLTETSTLKITEENRASKIEWGKIDGAIDYECVVDSVSKTTKELSEVYNFKGSHTVKVRAIGDGKTTISSDYKEIKVEKLDSPEIMYYESDKTKIVWNDIFTSLTHKGNAVNTSSITEKYIAILNSNDKLTINYDVNIGYYIDLTTSLKQGGDNDITIYANAIDASKNNFKIEDGSDVVYYVSSTNSDSLLAKQLNSSVLTITEDGELCWNQNQNATGYKLVVGPNTYTFASTENSTALSDLNAGTYTAHLTVLGGATNNGYLFDSVVSSKEITKLNNNPTIAMQNGDLVKTQDVNGLNGATATYIYNLYKQVNGGLIEKVQTLLNFTDLSAIYGNIEGDALTKYILSVKVKANQFITSNTNENLFEFYKLPTTFDATINYGEGSNDENAVANLQFRQINNSEKTRLTPVKEGVNFTHEIDKTAKEVESVNLSYILRESAGLYTFNMQAIGNTTTTSGEAYMSSDVVNLNGLTLTILDTPTVSVTTFNNIKGGLDFTDPQKSSGNLTWNAIDSASGYIVSITPDGEATQEFTTTHNYLPRETFTGDAGEYTICVRAYGNKDQNVVCAQVEDKLTNTLKFKYSQNKQVVKLDNITNLYTQNNAIYYEGTSAKYNNVSMATITSPDNIFVEYVVELTKSDNSVSFYQTYNYSAIEDKIEAISDAADLTEKQQAIQNLINFITSTKFEEFSNIDGTAKLPAGNYFVKVYTMPYNAVVQGENLVENGAVEGAKYYLTSNASKSFKVHINNTASNYELTNGYIRFNGDDVGSETLTEDTYYNFDASAVKIYDATSNKFITINETVLNNDYMGFDTSDGYYFKTGKTKYYYQIEISLKDTSTKILAIVPSLAMGSYTYNLYFKDMVNKVAGDYDITIKTIIVGKSTADGDRRLDSANLTNITTKILSTNGILKTRAGELTWDAVVGATSYTLYITSISASKTYTFDKITTETTSITSVDLSKTITIVNKTSYYLADLTVFDSGDYIVEIIVNGDENVVHEGNDEYITSETSAHFNITKLAVVDGIRVVNGKISFNIPSIDKGVYKLTYRDANSNVKTQTYSLSDNSLVSVEGYYQIIFPASAEAGLYFISFVAVGNDDGFINSDANLNLTGSFDETSNLKVNKLEAVKELTIDENGFVSWDAVGNASGYYITINSKTFKVSNNKLTNQDILDYNNGKPQKEQISFGTGEQTIEVYASGDGLNYLSGIDAYIDGFYETNNSITVNKLIGLSEYDICVQDGKFIWKQVNSNNKPFTVPNALRITVSYEGITEPIVSDVDISKIKTIEKIENISGKDELITYYFLDINDTHPSLNVYDKNYTITFINLGGIVGEVNYCNSETATLTNIQKLKNVEDPNNKDGHNNPIPAIAVDCVGNAGEYNIDKIYFEVFDINASSYILTFTKKGGVSESYICKYCEFVNGALDTTNLLEGELAIADLGENNEVDGYRYYVSYKGLSITEGNYTISMQAIGNNLYLNSSIITTTEFFVPSAPEIFVERSADEENKDTGRIYWNAPTFDDKKDITYVITYKRIATTTGEVNESSFTNPEEEGTINFTITVDGKNITFVNNKVSYEKGKIYYTFDEMGHYLVEVLCYVNGLPSASSKPLITNKDGETVVDIIDFSFFAAGSGTLENPYKIINLSQLNAIKYRLSSHYVLGANIEIDNIHDLSSLTLDGSISGLYIVKDEFGAIISQTQYSLIVKYEIYNLFNTINVGAKVFNLKIIVEYEYTDAGKTISLIATTNNGEISDVEIMFNHNSSFLNFSAVCYTNNGTILNAQVKGEGVITLGDNTPNNSNANAGAVAMINYGTISNCSNAINLYSGNTESNIYVGGIVKTNNGIIEKCSNSGNILGCTIGGICAENKKVITECFNTGLLTVYDTVGHIGYAGGIVGNNIGTALGVDYIEKCYNIGNIIAGNETNAISTGVYIGGIVGRFISNCSIEKDNSTQVKYCYSLGGITLYTTLTNAINDNNNVYIVAIGGIVGYAHDSNLQNRDEEKENVLITYCYSDVAQKVVINYTGAGNTGITSYGGIAGYLYGIIENCYTTHQNIVPHKLSGASVVDGCITHYTQGLEGLTASASGTNPAGAFNGVYVKHTYTIIVDTKEVTVTEFVLLWETL